MNDPARAPEPRTMAPSAAERYRAVRERTVELADLFTVEDQALQSMPDASPTKWHLAHTTWFFETFVLCEHAHDYRPHQPEYRYLFNSYYNAIGAQFPRPRRGMLSRPSAAEVRAYRAVVDDAMVALLEGEHAPAVAGLLEIGLHHEQQHQELIVTDIKHALSDNPLGPRITSPPAGDPEPAPPPRFVTFEEGLYTIGQPVQDRAGFCFDNETPRHKVYLEAFRVAARPVINAEYLAFVRDGGYQDPALWLSDGWAFVREHGLGAPLYWELGEDGTAPSVYTLGGALPLDLAGPVCHLSYYEADAFARWSGKRLPTEAEWEVAAMALRDATDIAPPDFVDLSHLHPRAIGTPAGTQTDALFGGVWEWTASPYVAYPGYRPAPGAVGEYNGKFMSGQMVLRGGSCATPDGHLRPTYRNFFPPDARWQFSGLRLAE